MGPENQSEFPLDAIAPQSNDIRSTLKKAMAQLRSAQITSHTLAAELLLINALGHDRTWIYTHPETVLDSATTKKYFALISRRVAGEPTQYLTGKQEFWGLEFEVNPAVLIPRPETEHVMEVALERLGARGLKIRLDTGGPSLPLYIADVGTGSGCLAIALAYELPHANVFATDISAPALGVAKRNAELNDVGGRVHFLQTNLLDALSHQSKVPASANFDVIVSNPPYVALNDAGSLPREVREHEPHTALFGGRTGVEMYSRLIEQASGLLCERGVLVLELGYNSVDHVLKIVRDESGWANVSVTNDLAGIPRVIAAERVRP